ncbi:MAG: YbaN family protein [Gammaproteobacteria bacterium]|nr:YbaN family protein [Gammaproteobacteria bacterium]
MSLPRPEDSSRNEAPGSTPGSAGRSRVLYITLGWLCIALGTLGAFLPLLPTTVFLLIAAWAFARSSPRWHAWLREHAHFGEAVRAWEEHHAMPRRAKRIAFLALAASYAFTAYVFGPFSWTAIIGGICIAGVAIYIAHIPVLKTRDEQTVRT